MATLQGRWLSQRSVSLKGALYVRTWRGKIVVAKWPRGKSGNIDAGTIQRMVDFKHAQTLAKYLIPQQQMAARDATEGTPLLPRDLLTAAMYGRLWSITTTTGRQIFSVAAASDVSANLELLPTVRPIIAPPPPPPPVPTMEEDVSRLTKSGADLKLIPLNGNTLTIEGAAETIPSAGVTLAPAGLPIDTDHYIYAFMVAGTMTLEASTTGRSTDATTGVEIKTGDDTRTLVGMARTIAGPAWVDTPAQRFVISWFNRRTINAQKTSSVGLPLTSTVQIEISTAYRAEFLTWADEMPIILFTGTKRNSTANMWTAAWAFIDTVAVTGQAMGEGSSTANDFINLTSGGAPITVAEGYHFSTLQGRVEGGTATIWNVWNSTLISG